MGDVGPPPAAMVRQTTRDGRAHAAQPGTLGLLRDSAALQLLPRRAFPVFHPVEPPPGPGDRNHWKKGAPGPWNGGGHLASISQSPPARKPRSRRDRPDRGRKGGEMEGTDLDPLDVSSRPPPAEWGEPDGSTHVVQFYEDDAFLFDAVGRFIGPALGAGETCLIIATAPHRAQIAEHLATRGFDLSALSEQGRYVTLDAAETLSRFLVDGGP